MDDDQTPLDLSKRDQVKHSRSQIEGGDTADNTQNEKPLNLCIKTRPSSPAPYATQTRSPVPDGSLRSSEALRSRTQHQADGEHSDQRRTAAFALCQLACSSSQSQDSATCRNTQGPLCPSLPTSEQTEEPTCTPDTRLSMKRVNQAQEETVGGSKREAQRKTGKKASAKPPNYVPKKRPRCS